MHGLNINILRPVGINYSSCHVVKINMEYKMKVLLTLNYQLLSSIEN